MCEQPHAEAPALPVELEEGPDAQCGLCKVRIVKDLPWFRCAECEGPLYLCAPCFLSGRSGGAHRNDHGYVVMRHPGAPLGGGMWSPREEFGLLEGVEQHGLGNWEAVARRVDPEGSRSAVECRSHYEAVYLLDPALGLVSDQRRAEVRQRAAAQRVVDQALRAQAEKVATMPGSNIAGFMPLRECYDFEFVNHAEAPLVHLTFSPEEAATVERGDDKPVPGSGSDEDSNLAVKLRLLDAYAADLEERERRKSFVRERGLLDTRARRRAWRRATPAERAVRQSLRSIERFSSPSDHEKLVHGLTREMQLREQLRQLRAAQPPQPPRQPGRAAPGALVQDSEATLAAVFGLRGEEREALCASVTQACEPALSAHQHMRVEVARQGRGLRVRMDPQSLPPMLAGDDSGDRGR